LWVLVAPVALTGLTKTVRMVRIPSFLRSPLWGVARAVGDNSTAVLVVLVVVAGPLAVRGPRAQRTKGSPGAMLVRAGAGQVPAAAAAREQ